MASSSPVRVIVTLVMDVLVLVAVLLAAAVVVSFFGALAQTGVGEGVQRIGSFLTLPLGFGSIETRYGGVFEADAAATMLVALLAEWVLATARRRL